MALSLPSLILGQEKKDDADKRPERLVEMAVEYPGIVVNVGENVTMDVFLYNKGRKEEMSMSGLPLFRRTGRRNSRPII